MFIIGIDPGQKGAFALMDDGGVLISRPMFLAGKSIDISLLAITIKTYMPDYAVVEKVHSMPKQGVASSFKFGKSYGIVLGVLSALSIPTILVTPRAWKRKILAGTKKDKDAAIEYVRMKYPSFNLIPKGCRKPNDGMADAICLAEYGFFDKEKNNG
jgi:crossover junction endodeoxyribonuclease RuvC